MARRVPLVCIKAPPAGGREAGAWFTWIPLLIISIAFFAAAAKNPTNSVKPWLVKSVSISGNVSLSTANLLKNMDCRPSGLFHKVKFSQSLLNTDIETIAHRYRSKGFLAIRVKADKVTRDRLRRRVTVHIAVSEGPQTLIDSVLVTGSSLFTQAEINRIIRVKPPMPYSEARLTRAQQKIRDTIVAHGYLLSTVDRTDRVDSTAHRAVVVFQIAEGPLAVAGPITVSGAKRLRRVIVKKGLTFHEGDTLTTERVRQSVRRMYETGMFNYAQITTPAADSAAQRRMAGPIPLPVNIAIEETDFYQYQGGIGYGTYEGVRLSLRTSYGNVLGWGRTIGLEGKYSSLVKGLHLRYTAPWFLLLPPTAEAEVYGERHDEVTFIGDLEGLTVSLSAKTPWNLGYRGYTSFEWIQGKAAVAVDPALAHLTHANNTQSFGIGFIYDLRDNMFDPVKGLLATTDEELSGLIGANTNHFYKFTIDARVYVPLSRTLTAATAAIVGFVNGYGVDREIVPPQELFYPGSETIRSVRGYPPGLVGDAAGGRLVLVINALELRFALTKWLKIAGFADAGYAWTSASLFDARDLRWTAGPGLRIRSPIGFLSTDMGFRLNGPTRKFWGFSVSIGEPF